MSNAILYWHATTFSQTFLSAPAPILKSETTSKILSFVKSILNRQEKLHSSNAFAHCNGLQSINNIIVKKNNISFLDYKNLLRWAERVWPRSAARRSQTARAWPRAAQHKRLWALTERILQLLYNKKRYLCLVA